MNVAIRAAIKTSFLLFCLTSAGASQTERTVVALKGDIGVEPSEGSLLARQAGLAAENVTVAEALTLLSQATNVSVAFSPNSLPPDRRVDCPCQDRSIADALNQILSGTEFGYLELGDQIVVVRRTPTETLRSLGRPASLVAQDGMSLSTQLAVSVRPHRELRTLSLPTEPQETTLSGTVIDAGNGRPVAGAQVVVVGTRIGALTNNNGHFRLTGLTGPSVEIEVVMMGFRTERQVVRVGASDVRIELSQTAVDLDAIVVTGTPGGTQKRAIGNSVAQLNAGDVMEVAPVQTITDMLTGRAAGVVMTPMSGTTGTGPRISIRGRSSLSLASDPLIYVDGIRVSNDPTTGPGISDARPISRISDINPEDIERIEVIKGPAAATLYGTEASNGVIQIITKRGSTSAPTIDVTIRQGVQWFPDAADRIGPSWGVYPATGEVIEMNLVDREASAGNDIFKAGHLQGYGANVQGGTNDVQYYLGMDLDRDQGIEPTNRLNRLSTRLNLFFPVNEKLDLRTNFSLVKSRVDLSPELNASVMPSLVFGLPAFLDSPKRGFLLGPPEAMWDVYDNVFQTVSRTTAGLQINNVPTDWFSQRLTVGLDLTSEGNQAIIERMPDDYILYFGAQMAKGNKNITFRDVSYTTVDYSGTASVQLREGLGSTTSLGLQYYRNFAEYTSATGQEFPTPGLTSTNAAAVTFGGDDFVENATVGVYVQQQFSWQDRIFVTGALRADDNSAFGEDFDLVYYPKLSAAWVLNEEPFWNVPWVETLRLRAAYGQSGQQPQAFAALRTYSPITGPGDQAALTPGSVGNPDLAPERGVEYEVGFEAGLFSDRLGLDFTFYHQTTDDVILSRDVSPSSGFVSSQFINAGRMLNRGIELGVNALVLDTRDADLELTATLSTNHNEILDLGGLPAIIGSYTRHQEGYPAASFFGKKVVNAEWDSGGNLTNVLCRGDPESGGGEVPCSDAPEVFLGGPLPKTEGSVTASLTLFRRLRLHGMADFKSGLWKWDVTRWGRCAVFQACEINYFPERFGALEAARIQEAGGSFTGYVRDATFAKLREVSATYTVPEPWAGSFGASRATVTLAGRNLYTWAPHWTGLDPETVNTRTYFSYASEQALLPQLAQLVTTIRLTF